MDLTPLQPAFVFLHVVSAFVFVAGHGVSLAVAFRLRAEREPARMASLLDLSAWSLGLAGVGMLGILVSGIVAGIVGGHFARGWGWASIALFVIVGGTMTPLGAGYFNAVRRALGIRAGVRKDDPDPVALGPAEIAEADAMLAGATAEEIVRWGFLLILWLMMTRPF